MARSADNSKRIVSAVAATVVALAAGTNVRCPDPCISWLASYLVARCVG